MARLNHPADPSRLTPVAEQALDATPSSEPAISSPTPTQASLQSHRNNDLPYPPARGGSERLSFSPADCRTLDKLLQDTDSNSAPQTPSAIELDDRRSSNSRSTSALQNHTHAYGGYNLVGDEATDAGYKDEDGSMELSDGTEGVVAYNASNTISNSASPSLSWSAPRLQDSVLMHDEKSTLGYTDRRLGSEMHPKLKQHEYQQQAPGDIRLSNQLGYSLPILPENESVE
ncbi:hypothetical protein C7974DRAFT_470889, partial [Boeremia exigua]|uniref:uncharacterized protein n=1 Tax=Boeremia exigua TaxID=749465 RepID=UPI001E8CB011